MSLRTMSFRTKELVKSFVHRLFERLTSPRQVVLVSSMFFRAMGATRLPVPLAQVKRIVICRVDVIGDMVLLSPFVRELRKNFPAAHIALVVQPVAESLYKHCPYIDELIVAEVPAPSAFYHLRLHSYLWRFAMKELLPRRFDLAFAPNWAEMSVGSFGRYLAYYSQAPIRIGFREREKKNGKLGFDNFFTELVDLEPLQHEVDKNLALLKHLHLRVEDESLEIALPPESEQELSAILAANANGYAGDYVAMAPFSRNRLKEWPAQRFLEVAAYLFRQYGIKTVILGGKEDNMYVGNFLKEANAEGQDFIINLCGKTTLTQTAVALRRSLLFFGNDTGTMHIAAAVKTPVVALFGSSCLHRYAPRGEAVVIQADLPCAPCRQAQHPIYCGKCIYAKPECMYSITVEQVREALDSSLSKLEYFRR